jgi:hypothetical protein
MRMNMTIRAKLFFSALALVAVAAAPAAARDAKATHSQQVEPATDGKVSAMVAEPGDRRTRPVDPAYVGRSYWDAARHDFDRQMNRGL